MYYLKVNGALKVLVTETADACGITTAAIMRKVALKIAHNTLGFTDDRNEVVFRRGDNVTAHVDVPQSLTRLYGKNDTIKSEMQPPTVSEAQYRLAIAGACLETMSAIHAARMRERYARMDAPATMRTAAAEVAR